MLKNKRVILMSFLIVAAAAVLFEHQRHQGSRLTTRIASNASGAGVGVVSSASNGPGSFIEPARLTNGSKAGSQRTLIAGGAGSGRATPVSSVKGRTPGVSPEVLEAAEVGLPFFLGQIPPGSKELYGFASTDDLSTARLGAALQMHTITPAAIQQSSPGTTVSSILSDTSMWFFPILIESESKAMLVVDRDDGTWKAVSLGYAGLGHELNALLAQWPESKGFHPQLIAVFQARQFYFTVAQVDDFNLTQLRVPQAGFSYSTVPTTGPQAEPQNYGNLSAVSKSLEELKPIVLSAQNYPTR